MEKRKKRIKELVIRLSLISIALIVFFLLITFPIDAISNFSIYKNRNEYQSGNMRATGISTDSYGSSHLFASGYIRNIKTSVYLGLEKEVQIKDYYPIWYKPDGKQSFFITKNFKFDPLKHLYYGIFEVLSIPLFLFIISKIYKYFKNTNLEF